MDGGRLLAVLVTPWEVHVALGVDIYTITMEPLGKKGGSARGVCPIRDLNHISRQKIVDDHKELTMRSRKRALIQEKGQRPE